MTKKTETVDAEIIEKGAVVLVPITDLMFTKGVNLSELARKYAQMPEIDLQSDNLGEVYQEYLKGTKEVGKAFNLIEKTRKTVKDPVLQYGRKIDATAKELKAIIEPTRDKLMDGRKLIENEEQRKQDEAERLERERQMNIHNYIELIKNLPMSAIGKTSLEIQDIIRHASQPTLQNCEERLSEAVTIWKNTSEALDGMYLTATKAENADRILEEEGVKRAEAEARAEAERAKEKDALRKEREEFELEKAEHNAIKIAEQEAKNLEQVEREAEEREKAEIAQSELDVANTLEMMEKVKETTANEFYDAYGVGGVDTILERLFNNEFTHVRWEV